MFIMKKNLALFIMGLVCLSALETVSAQAFVDLGLSVKWSTYNVGATAEHELGDYYAWGETAPKAQYSWVTYAHANGSNTTITKYNYNAQKGIVDNKYVLDSIDDAAAVNWGGAWRMPTKAEWEELQANCTLTTTTDYNGTGVAGFIMTSNVPGYTNQSVFFPAGGTKDGGTLRWRDEGYYASSTLSVSSSEMAENADFMKSGRMIMMSTTRMFGMLVRPVVTSFVITEPILPASGELLLAAENTVTSSYIPLSRTLLAEGGYRCQMIYTAEMIGNLPDSTLFTSLTLFPANGQIIDPKLWTIRLGETNLKNFSLGQPAYLTDSSTLVYTGTLVNNAGEITIDFDTPYLYRGGNLFVELNMPDRMYIGYLDSFYAIQTSKAQSITGCAGWSPTPRYNLAKIRLEYEPAPSTCPKPSELAVDSVVAGINAFLHWNNTGASQYLLKWQSAVTRDSMILTDTVASLTNLMPQEQYQVAVASICSPQDTSLFKKMTLVTGCLPVDDFPWNMNFSALNEGVFSHPCWENEHIAGDDTDVFTVFKFNNDPEKVLRLGWMPEGNITRLSLPEMDFSPTASYEFSLKFERIAPASYLGDSFGEEGIRIYQGDSLLGFISHDYTVADTLHGVPSETQEGMYTYTFMLPYSGLQRIVIEGVSQDGFSMYMRDFQVREIPTCFVSKTMQMDSISTRSASFSWTSVSGESEWQIRYRVNDTEAYQIDTVVGTPQYVIGNLRPVTSYNLEIILHAICGTQLSPDSLIYRVSGTTQCSCPAPTNLRVEDADTTSITFAWSSDAPSYHVLVASPDSVIRIDTIVSDTTLTISGLVNSTAYRFAMSVVAVCGIDDESDVLYDSWVEAATECVTIASLPWVEDFERMPGNIAPACWTMHGVSRQYLTFGSVETAKFGYTNTSVTYTALRFSYGYGEGQTAVLPTIADTIDLSQAELSITYWCYEDDPGSIFGSPQTFGKMEIGAMSDPSDLITYVKLADIPQNKDFINWAQFNLPLTSIPAGYQYLAIRYKDGVNDGSAYIREIRLSMIPQVNGILSPATTDETIQKIIRNGQLIIRRNDTDYNAVGQRY